MKNRIQIFSVLVFLLVLGSGLYGQGEWIVPEAQKVKLSKFEFDDQSRQAGEAFYQTNCKSCHGDPGQANFLTTLSPQPGDPASEKFQSNLDGELYFSSRFEVQILPKALRFIYNPKGNHFFFL